MITFYNVDDAFTSGFTRAEFEAFIRDESIKVIDLSHANLWVRWKFA